MRLITKFLELHEVQRMLWELGRGNLNMTSTLHSVVRILLPIYSIYLLSKFAEVALLLGIRENESIA